MRTPAEPDDAFGCMLLDRLAGGRAAEIINRDDGLAAAGGQGSFAPLVRGGAPRYPPCPRAGARRRLRRRPGCRPPDRPRSRGRRRRCPPGAAEVWRRCGLVCDRLEIAGLSRALGSVDSVVMFGNDGGLLGSQRRAPALLRRLAVTAPGARVLAGSADPSTTEDPAHLRSQARDPARGGLSGWPRLRVRSRALATPGFEHLLVSEAELAGPVGRAAGGSRGRSADRTVRARSRCSSRRARGRCKT